MEAFMAFLSSFASYLLVFIVFVAVICIACFIGIQTAKAKNKKKQEMTDAQE